MKSDLILCHNIPSLFLLQKPSSLSLYFSMVAWGQLCSVNQCPIPMTTVILSLAQDTSFLRILLQLVCKRYWGSTLCWHFFSMDGPWATGCHHAHLVGKTHLRDDETRGLIAAMLEGPPLELGEPKNSICA